MEFQFELCPMIIATHEYFSHFIASHGILHQTVRIITYCIINLMYRVLSVGNYLLPYLLLHLIMPSILEQSFHMYLLHYK